MKKIVFLISALLGINAMAQVSIMKHTYLLCSSTDDSKSAYSLILENAAISEATDIKLIKSENTGWKNIANRKIEKIKLLADSPIPEHYVKQYSGKGFVAVRSVMPDNKQSMLVDEVSLSINVDGQSLQMKFVCSEVN